MSLALFVLLVCRSNCPLSLSLSVLPVSLYLSSKSLSICPFGFSFFLFFLSFSLSVLPVSLLICFSHLSLSPSRPFFVSPFISSYIFSYRLVKKLRQRQMSVNLKDFYEWKFLNHWEIKLTIKLNAQKKHLLTDDRKQIQIIWERNK